MGRIRPLSLMMLAWILVAGPGCTEETVSGNPSCDALYGGISGYEFCDETDASCVFHHSETPAISCAAICAFSGALCIEAHVHQGGDCDPNDPQGCPRVDGYAQLCSFAAGSTCVNVCEGATSMGGCETDADCDAPMVCDNDELLGGSSCNCVDSTNGVDEQHAACLIGAEIPCDQPESDAVCECGGPPDAGTGGTSGTGGGGGTGGGNGTRTLAERCEESSMVYCENGYRCRDLGWSVSAQTFRDFYGESSSECLSSGTPCTTEEAYCEDRSFPGTYDAANHEACIAGQRSYGCEVDALNLPVFPPECDEICVE